MVIFGYAFCTQIFIKIHVYEILTIVAEIQPSVFEDLYRRFSDLGTESVPKNYFQATKMAIFVPNFFGCTGTL